MENIQQNLSPALRNIISTPLVKINPVNKMPVAPVNKNDNTLLWFLAGGVLLYIFTTYKQK